MATIEIELDAYLSDADKREVCTEAFRAAVTKRTEKDFERILSNAGYHLVSAQVDAAMGGDMQAVIASNAVKVINKLCTFTVFGKPDAWGREASRGWVHLQAAMDEAAPAIRARVLEIVANLDEETLREIIVDNLAASIMEKLQSKPTP